MRVKLIIDGANELMAQPDISNINQSYNKQNRKSPIKFLSGLDNEKTIEEQTLARVSSSLRALISGETLLHTHTHTHIDCEYTQQRHKQRQKVTDLTSSEEQGIVGRATPMPVRTCTRV